LFTLSASLEPCNIRDIHLALSVPGRLSVPSDIPNPTNLPRPRSIRVPTFSRLSRRYRRSSRPCPLCLH
jgi:hypothetical protein